MVLGLLVFAGALVIDAPLWVAIVAGLAVGGLMAATGKQRRRERARRAAELAARRAEQKQVKRTARKAAIKDRTGLDVDLVARAAQDAVHTVGSRITRKLEERYPAPDAAPARNDDWLDLDEDFDVMQSRRTTEEALRLSDELRRTRSS